MSGFSFQRDPYAGAFRGGRTTTTGEVGAFDTSRAAYASRCENARAVARRRRALRAVEISDRARLFGLLDAFH